MASLFQLPRAAPISALAMFPGCRAYFYETGTTTPKDTYTTSALSVAHAHPVVADASGVFPEIWLDTGEIYKLTLNTAADVLIYTSDPVSEPREPFYIRTAAEIAAGVTPVNYSVAQITVEGVLRYQTNTTPGTTDMQPAFAAANNVGYAGFTDGTNSPFKATTGVYGIGDTVDVDYGVSLYGDGQRSTRLVALSAFASIGTDGMVRIGNGAQVSGGSRVTDMIIDCASFASSIGVMSSDIQHGGAERVTVNNFRGTGFKMDANGTAFGSINGYLLQQCEAFKANLGGTSGTAYYLRDGTFYPLLQLCQSYGNPSNPLAVGFDINNTPVVLLSSNVDGAAAIGIDFNASSQGAVVGFTSNGATTAVNIDTALDVTLIALYMPAGTSSVIDAGNGGGKAKTLTQSSVPLYWRGQNYAHGDFLKIWGTEEVIDLYVNGTIRYGQSATTPDIADGGTVSSSGVSVSRYTPAANRTGLILAAGTQSGQMVTVVNNSSNTMTFAAAGTSNVADGTGMVIAALKAAQFVWDSSAARWFHCA